jgi:nitric oxide reductase subunit C
MFFRNAPVGTAQSAKLAEARPTMTALVALVPTPLPAKVTELPAQCKACHTVNGVGGAVGPELTHVATHAAQRIEDPTYSGSATTPEEYIHESIMEPSAYIVPGFTNPASPSTSMMPPYGGLTALQNDPTFFDMLVDYLATLE